MKERKEVEDGCGGCKSLVEEIYWKHVKRLRFCVSLTADFHHKLLIPQKFAENMMPSIFLPKMNLKGPSGASWEVTLMRNVDGLFLQDGWEDFVNAYSLEENDILFFKYDRNSCFDVKIFDGECEKEAAYFVKKCGHLSPAVNADEVCVNPNKKLRKDDGLRPCVRKRKKIPSRPSPIQLAMRLVRKKAALRSAMDVQGRYSHAGCNQNGSTSNEIPSADQNTPRVTQDLHAGRDNNASTSNEIPSADQNTPRVTQDSHVGRELVVAKQPDQNGSTNKEVTENCPLAFFRRVGRKRSRKSLPPGVTMYASNRRPVTEVEKTEAFRKAASELSENSFFAAMRFTCCYKGFFMTIPSKFVTKHFSKKTQDVTLRVGEKKWATKFSFSRSGIATGWKKFALDNNLEEWDVCLFKLTGQENDETKMLDVSIFRVVEEITPPTLLTTDH